MSGPWSGASGKNSTNDVEEGYWRSLLYEGEIVSSPPPEELERFHCRPSHVEEGGFQEEQEDWRSRTEDWDAAEQAYAAQEVLTLPVTGYNRGGLLVQFRGLYGFVPASHLTDLPRFSDSVERLRTLAQYVGNTIEVCIIEIAREQGRLVMSQRAARECRDGAELLQCLKPGDVRHGRVTSVRPFGAFVDLGGVEGLLHISELSWGRVARPDEIVRPGDEVDVYVMDVDVAQRRIALSLKRLKPNPWESVAERYQVGQVVSGVVTNVVSFGAFVRLEEGVEGLVHISELAEGQFLHPRNVVQEGDVVRVRVLNVDPDNHRIGLSMRRVGREDIPQEEIQDTSSVQMGSTTQEPAAAW